MAEMDSPLLRQVWLIVTAAGFIESTEGPVIGIFHQYAHHGEGKSIHSVPQMLDFVVHVDSTSTKKNGMQRVVTPYGWIIPLHVRNGLAYMDMRPPTQDEYETYDHVVSTSDVTWDPTVLDNEMDLNVPNDNLIVDINEECYDARSTDIGEKGTQRIIEEMLWDCHERDASLSLNVLDHEDTLDFLASEKYFCLLYTSDAADE